MLDDHYKLSKLSRLPSNSYYPNAAARMLLLWLFSHQLCLSPNIAKVTRPTKQGKQKKKLRRQTIEASFAASNRTLILVKSATRSEEETLKQKSQSNNNGGRQENPNNRSKGCKVGKCRRHTSMHQREARKTNKHACVSRQ